ncbi:fimbrial protein [Erwinia sp. 9145]|uniref:fimbrial protein n=1 Tax=Erwinia sp. 9145 TaxID=1500895 RepID=UPI000550F53F|nr:fimbrial protein [Erwinia sp. 9145]
MKKTLVASLMTAALGVVSFSSFAAPAPAGTITINGKLTAATCTVKVNDSATGDGIVNLPTLSTSKLATAGATAGETNFLIKLSACNPQTGTVRAYFESGANVDAASGRLNNAAASGASNVQVELLTANADVLAAGNTSQRDIESNKVTLNAGAADMSYIARYYATGATTAGDLQTAVTYSIDYN